MQHATRTLYFVVFAALMALLAATVLVAHLHFGVWSAVVAMAIAVVKTALIGLYFMHLRWEPPLVRLFAVAGLLWLALLLGIVVSDYRTRERSVRAADVAPAATAVQSEPLRDDPVPSSGRDHADARLPAGRRGPVADHGFGRGVRRADTSQGGRCDEQHHAGPGRNGGRRV